jgi:hypothetical protein
LQRRQGVGHFRHQGFSQSQKAASAGWGLTPRQGDLGSDVFPEIGCGHSCAGLGTALQSVERDGDPSL